MSSRTAFSWIAATRLRGRATWPSSTTSPGCGRTSPAGPGAPRGSAGTCVPIPRSPRCTGAPTTPWSRFPSAPPGCRPPGDYWGVHSHPIRWAPESGQWVHEFGDGDWPAQATRFALDAFGGWAGAPPRLFRAGSGVPHRPHRRDRRAGRRRDRPHRSSRSPAGGWAPRRCRPAWTPRPSWARTPIAGARRGSPTVPRATISASTGAGRAGGSSWCRSPRAPSARPRPRWRRAARRVLRGPRAVRGGGALPVRRLAQRPRVLGRGRPAAPVDAPALSLARHPHGRAQLRGGRQECAGSSTPCRGIRWPSGSASRIRSPPFATRSEEEDRSC